MSEETRREGACGGQQPDARPAAEQAADRQPGAETQAGTDAEKADGAAQPGGDAAAPEAAPQPAAPAAAEDTDKRETEKEKKESRDWFNKKARELEALKGRLDTAEKKAAEAREQLLRTAAEYDNYRKRTAREADQKFNDGVSFAVNQIIPILDTLEMAEKAPCEDENFKKGVTMTLGKAAKALEALHIEEIEAEGKPFDPNTMNAVSQVPAPEGTAGGSVVTVYQKGYRIGDKVIRHATVVVAE